MKKLALILAVLFISLQTSNVSAKPLAQTKPLAEQPQSTELCAQDIINYLVARKYSVQDLWQNTSSCNWTALTCKNGNHYVTTVFTNCSEIFGHEDAPI